MPVWALRHLVAPLSGWGHPVLCQKSEHRVLKQNHFSGLSPCGKLLLQVESIARVGPIGAAHPTRTQRLLGTCCVHPHYLAQALILFPLHHLLEKGLLWLTFYR